MKRVCVLFCLLAGILCAKAQIGYQISLLNTATGEPRANESVVVSVTLSNSAGEAFYSETKKAITNDFGVLSLSIGNADTFKDVDLTKMPFYIEVTANGVMIGKSQILNVPVAEVAKRVVPINEDLIVGEWKCNHTYYGKDYILSFNKGGLCSYKEFRTYNNERGLLFEYSGYYEIEGNTIYAFFTLNDSHGTYSFTEQFHYLNGKLGSNNGIFTQ